MYCNRGPGWCGRISGIVASRSRPPGRSYRTSNPAPYRSCRGPFLPKVPLIDTIDVVGFLALLLLTGAAPVLNAQTGENLLLVVNRNDGVSRQIADYYRTKRAVPPQNVCSLAVTSDDEISWEIYQQQIEKPVGECLKKAGLQEKVLYIVMTLGIPFKVSGGGTALKAEYASVDSELTLLYSKLKGATVSRVGGVDNPFFMKRDVPFRHPQFPIYLVTRLAGYDFDTVKAMVDRGLAARNRGKFVVDLSSPDDEE